MLQWLVIGIGDITIKRVLPAILQEPRSRLAGIVTRNPDKAGPYHTPAWTNLETALAECPCNAVYVGTPPSLHAPQTLTALHAGKHVLCEKPMAMNHAEAARMTAAARHAQRTLGIAYYRRMYPKVNRAVELLREGVIGPPVFAEATSHDWFDPTGGPRSWLIDPQLAGAGPLLDIASHRIDLMNYFFGNPIHATGQASNAVHRFAVEDNATVLIEYESGTRAMVDVRWHSRTARDEFRIRGTDGEMDLSPLNSPALRYPGGHEQIPAPENLHYPCIEDFVSAVLENRQPRSNGESAMLTDWVSEHVVRTSTRAL
jgi:1,5-anhydro-D-fructose reductase (1,5-anhydro-D-mannitol-forming)